MLRCLGRVAVINHTTCQYPPGVCFNRCPSGYQHSAIFKNTTWRIVANLYRGFDLIRAPFSCRMYGESFDAAAQLSGRYP